MLYRAEYLSFGKARELAGRSTAAVQWLLGKREVERHYTAEDHALNLKYARD